MRRYGFDVTRHKGQRQGYPHESKLAGHKLDVTDEFMMAQLLYADKYVIYFYILYIRFTSAEVSGLTD